MTRGEIWKDFFKRTVLPAVIALFLFFMFKNVFTEDGQTNYFYVWLCCGIPFGIRRKIMHSNVQSRTPCPYGISLRSCLSHRPQAG